MASDDFWAGAWRNPRSLCPWNWALQTSSLPHLRREGTSRPSRGTSLAKDPSGWSSARGAWSLHRSLLCRYPCNPRRYRKEPIQPAQLHLKCGSSSASWMASSLSADRKSRWPSRWRIVAFPSSSTPLAHRLWEFRTRARSSFLPSSWPYRQDSWNSTYLQVALPFLCKWVFSALALALLLSLLHHHLQVACAGRPQSGHARW